MPALLRSHQYLDDDPLTGTPQDTFVVGVTVSDNNGDSDSRDASPLVVKNVAPKVTAFTSDATDCGVKAEGAAIHVMGSFTDVGTRDTHTATINWGDHKPASIGAIVEAGGAGAITGSHVYTAGGIYRIIVTLTDDDTGQTTEQTFALITGVGILDGQLQVVGTKLADQVQVNRTGNGRFMAHASFLNDSPRSLSAAGVTSMAMILCDGNDKASVAGNISLPVFIEGGAGNDKLNGGNGPNILFGGVGDDQVIGGSSHDILVGDLGADRLIGNNGRDILIAGALGGPADPIDRLDAMFAILGEWSRNLNPTTMRPRLLVSGDVDHDLLTGSSGVDWFFFDFSEDKATDAKNELVENLG